MVYTINGGRRLPDVKHECYGKLSVKSFIMVFASAPPVDTMWVSREPVSPNGNDQDMVFTATVNTNVKFTLYSGNIYWVKSHKGR